MATLPARRALLAMAAAFAIVGVAPLGSARADSPADTRSQAAASNEVATDPSLRAAASRGGVDVLVSYQEQGAPRARTAATSTSARKRTAAEARRAFAAQKSTATGGLAGVRVKREYPNLPVQLVHVDSAAALRALATRPGVASLTPNGRNTIDPVAVQATAVGANQALIKQPEAVREGWNGDGVRVAVLDTGIAPTLNTDARNLFGNCASGPGTGTCRIATFSDVAGGSRTPIDVDSRYHHGTNVSGIVATTAPKAKLDVYNVFSDDGSGDVGAWDSDIIAALDDVGANATTNNIRAVSMSLGKYETYRTSACTNSPYSAIFPALRDQRVLPVVAAGNNKVDSRGSYHNGVSDPACATGAVAVGATYTTTLGQVGWGPGCYDNAIVDTVTCFSQTGPRLNILAPGVDITAAGVKESGTSQATPHVSGAVADLVSANFNASVDQIEAALETAGPSVRDPRSGTTVHRLDIFEAGGSLPTAPVLRVSGSNRYATSAAISRSVFPQTNVDVAYVASGQNFPDALSAGPAAGVNDAPLLLTQSTQLPNEIRAELQRLRPNRIVILGGASSVSTAVATELRTLARDQAAPISRIRGANRYETSALISQRTFAPGVDAVYVASGANFPDALAGGPIAAHREVPLLVTQPDALPASVEAELARLAPSSVIVLGGSSSVSEGVLTQIRGIAGVNEVSRIAGANRYETAARASASYYVGGAPGVFIASGLNFPDALSAAPAAGRLQAPILLTPPAALPPSTEAEVDRIGISWGYVLGGTSSVSNNALLQVQ